MYDILRLKLSRYRHGIVAGGLDTLRCSRNNNLTIQQSFRETTINIPNKPNDVFRFHCELNSNTQTSFRLLQS